MMQPMRKAGCGGTKLPLGEAGLPRRQGDLRVVFMYLGRGATLGHLVASLAECAGRTSGLAADFVISRGNARAQRGLANASSVLALPTIEAASPVATASNFFVARRGLLTYLAARRPDAIVNLMPHAWTPLWVGAIRRLGIAYVSVVHDAIGHPGDPTARLLPWLHREARAADLVIALSRHVAAQLAERRVVPPERIARLFLPDFCYGARSGPRARREREPLKLLLFGRLLPYKGLSLLLDALEIVRAGGVEVALGVVGAGDIGRQRPRLEALGAEIINRWIDEAEVGALLARYDAMALAHVECSQSAVAAAALGSGMPLVGVPVGGIAEQVVDGQTGVLARYATARSLADAIGRLATDRDLYRRIHINVAATAPSRSMPHFLTMLTQEIARLGSASSAEHTGRAASEPGWPPRLASVD